MKLHQLLAVQKTAKPELYTKLTKLYQLLGKSNVFVGMTKVWENTNEEYAEQRPTERQKVQYTVPDVLEEIQRYLGRIWDQTAAIDKTNQSANADVILEDGTTILRDVPTATLLFLEKQLADLHTIVKTIPAIDPAKDWHPSSIPNVYETDPVISTSTKNVMKPVVLYPATDKHPAQVKEATEAVPIGIWSTKYQSGALESKEIQRYLDNIETLQAAVKAAREQANTAQVTENKIARPILEFVFSRS